MQFKWHNLMKNIENSLMPKKFNLIQDYSRKIMLMHNLVGFVENLCTFSNFIIKRCNIYIQENF